MFQKLVSKVKASASFQMTNSRIFYVRGFQTSKRKVLRILLPFHLYLKKNGPNDGLVVYEDQLLKGIGIDLSANALDADHADLIAHVPTAHKKQNEDSNYRRAFTRALFRQLTEHAKK